MAFSLKACRVNKNLTLAEASKAIGVTKETISNWENGRSYPSINHIEKLLKVYDVAFDDVNFFTR